MEHDIETLCQVFVFFIFLLFFIYFRYASSRSTPLIDADGSQVTLISGQETEAGLEVDFNIPCSSSDVDSDVPASSANHLLFATGNLVGGNIFYHGQSKWIVDANIASLCGGK